MAVFLVANPASQQLKAYPPVATSSILSRLRAETRKEHEAVEQVLDLMSKSITHQIYRQCLEQFYGFYEPLEKALQARVDQWADAVDETSLSDATRVALAARLNKTALLRQDLHHLGVSAHGLDLCRDLPPLKTQSEVLGCLYVIEGATLGGRMITQHVGTILGISPTAGSSFFDGYGDDTARMWQGMRQLLLCNSPDTETENNIVTNAKSTFACLRIWCEIFTKTNTKRDLSSCAKT